jgi:hypothetical protein
MDIDQIRQNEIWSKIRQAQNGLMAARNYQRVDALISTQVIGFFALSLALFLDWELLLGEQDQTEPVFPGFFLLIFIALLPIVLINGWIVDAKMSLQTPYDRDRPIWLRFLRWVAACLFPMSEITAQIIWRKFLEADFTWARPARSRQAVLDLREMNREFPAPSRILALSNHPSRQMLSVLSTLAPIAGLASLLQSGEEAHRTILVLSVLAHLVALACSPALVEPLLRRVPSRWRLLVQSLRWLTLLPGPFLFPLLIIVPYMIGQDQELVHSAYTDREMTRRSPLWRQLERSLNQEREKLPLRTLWALPRLNHLPSESGIMVEERKALIRLKTLFLVPEAGLFFWFTATHAKIFSTDYSVVLPIFIGSAAFALAGLVSWFVPRGAALLRLERAAEAMAPYLEGGYLLFPAAAFLLGSFGGLLAARGGVQETALFLETAILFGSSLFLLRIGVRLNKNLGFRDFDYLWTWGGLFFALWMFQKVLALRPESAGLGLYLALSAPLLGLLAGLVAIPSHLHPFTWRSLFRRDLPVRLRAVLAVLTLTALLPLGGFAAPFWIWVRQRLWPRYEQLAENGGH